MAEVTTEAEVAPENEVTTEAEVTTEPKKRRKYLADVPKDWQHRRGMTLREFAALYGRKEAWGHQRARNGEIETIRICGTRMVTPKAIEEFEARQQEAAA